MTNIIFMCWTFLNLVVTVANYRCTHKLRKELHLRAVERSATQTGRTA